MDQTSRKKPSSPWSHQSKTTPAIMQSIDNPSLILTSRDARRNSNAFNIVPPDVTLSSGCEFQSLKLVPSLDENMMLNSFLLLDKDEKLQVSSVEEFLRALRCQDPLTRVKVVSIFGNTGDGKSYTLNHTLFNGENVFPTSNSQDSCTLGVWAAFDPQLKIICLDTEGLLGSTKHRNQRTRLLLKVLAVSDIVIYRTRAERLHEDMFTFLGSASRAYTHHFQQALQAVGKRGEFAVPLSALGPAVIIFHETRNTCTLNTGRESPEDVIRARFAQYNLEMDAFSSVRYIGTQTVNLPTNFKDLRAAITRELENTTVRSPRNPQLVFSTLKVLNEKFSGRMSDEQTSLFPDQYFTCSVVCLACDRRCNGSMGHLNENLPHSNSYKCRFQHQFGNRMYICKACHVNGKEVIVVPEYYSSNDASWFGIVKYAWSGYVIECPNCGEIYRSRQFLYGNAQPEAHAVRTEIHHVWPGSNCSGLSSQNSAQRVVDGVSYLYDGVVTISSQPTKAFTSFLADQIAPKYWRPNSEIQDCIVCHKAFSATDTKHHCRACGGVKEYVRIAPTITVQFQKKGGRCLLKSVTSVIKLEVTLVRNPVPSLGADDAEVRARKYGETAVNAVSSVIPVCCGVP
ncbi:zinc finger FYVE domain-containing protein 1-like [Homalodisca vitripennis]|uniref:zinc finger FYVE domain-containing protein 1-like n=1 Tax=Homalodisca vitripennis TaxID=197043 RepID=UPI001EEAF476|nr:zinc finger FYVE domain-containing protein 1-like [Homalodisca vitripennis]